MTSASTGWALRWTQNPAVADDGYLAPARTADGARTWTSVAPSAARALLGTPGAAVVLQALDGPRARLAVTAATTDSSPAHLTELFTASSGGRTWTEPAPLKVPGYASFLSVAGPEHGWLLIAYGGAMRQEPIQLYRTSDAGLRWSLVAETPQAGTGSNGLPVSCDKTGLVFATASAGWLSGACFSLSGTLRITEDLRAQLDIVAQLIGRTTTEEIRLALEHWIDKTKVDPAIQEKAAAIRAEIERDAQTRRNAIAAIFSEAGDAPAETGAPSTPRPGSRRNNSASE